MKEDAEKAGLRQAPVKEGMARLIYELHRRKDQARYSAARVAEEVMVAGFERHARQGAREN